MAAVASLSSGPTALLHPSKPLASHEARRPSASLVARRGHSPAAVSSAGLRSLATRAATLRATVSRATFPRHAPRLGGSHVRAEAENDKSEGKIPFGYTRKDVLLIGAGITGVGFALKYGLEAAGLDSFQSGAVVQLVVVLGLCLAWAGSYVWRVGNKEMTYVQQLKDYEDAVIQKRLEGMPEAELEAMLAEIEEEKQRIRQQQKGGQ
eukprot:TRINITY_DN40514_c0_g1_i1.p1 TRINITY_DN40514_c0_g1~~TRINITY_DN40514_c0_g1_i1.p1  ORF type:complete len:234 (-),score=0.73 TRINITY_DN40514_c0_g1_i1:311-934(-)